MPPQRLSLAAAALAVLCAPALAGSQAARPTKPAANAPANEGRQRQQPLTHSPGTQRPSVASPDEQAPPAPLSTYSVPWRSVNAGGGLRASANYRLGDAAGQAAVGGALGTSYGASAGFWVPATVSLVLAPQATSIPRGGQLRITVTVTNHTAFTQNFQFWSDVTLPTGGHFPVFGPFNARLGANQTRSGVLVHPIPNNAPLATFTYNAYVGWKASTMVWDDAHFPFTITTLEAPGEGGPPIVLAVTRSRGAHPTSGPLSEERAPAGTAASRATKAPSATPQLDLEGTVLPGTVVLEAGHWEGEFAVTEGGSLAGPPGIPGPSGAALGGGAPQAPALPTALEANYPNPFNPSTTIRYHVGEAGPVTLRIYDLRGRLVRTLVEGMQQPGSYTVHWDGRTGTGAAVASGVYLYQLQAGAYRATRTMILVK